MAGYGIMAGVRIVEVARAAETAAQHILSERVTLAFPSSGAEVQAILEAMYAFIGRSGTRVLGAPLMIFYDGEFVETGMDVELGVPFDKVLKPPTRWSVRELPAGPATVTLHAGHYADIAPAYIALINWMQERRHIPSEPPREVYLVGPSQVSEAAAY